MENLKIKCKCMKDFKFRETTEIKGRNAVELIEKIKSKLNNGNYDYIVATMNDKYYYDIKRG